MFIGSGASRGSTEPPSFVPCSPRILLPFGRRRGAGAAALAGLLLAILPPGLCGADDPLPAIRARAERGDPEALNALANAYANGDGITQNYPEAIRLYERAAGAGLAVAHFNLGLLYDLGRGVAPDAATAFQHYLRAATRGFAPAQFNVGHMYAHGVGTRQDYFEALIWLRPAAERGLAEAQFDLALAYEHGRGVGRDEALAQRWYSAAAAQGQARAQFSLGLMLEQGRGSPADAATAAIFYRAAAVQNYALAQNNLGLLLAEGRGVAADPIEGYKWLALAVENGADPSARNLVAGRLSETELAEANASLARARALVTGNAPALAAGRTGAADRPGSDPAAHAVGIAAAPPPPRPVSGITKDRSGNSEVPAASAPDFTAPGRRPADESSLGLLPSSLRAANPEPAATEKRYAVRTSEVPLPQLAAGDPRIARLMTENNRLNEEIVRTSVRLAQATRQLKSLEERAESEREATASFRATVGDPAEIKRRFEILRRTIAKLAEENRWYSAAQEELRRLQIENDRLKAGRPAQP